jgi:hypothetical protein
MATMHKRSPKKPQNVDDGEGRNELDDILAETYGNLDFNFDLTNYHSGK